MTKTEYIFNELKQTETKAAGAIYGCFENHYDHTKHTNRQIEDTLAIR